MSVAGYIDTPLDQFGGLVTDMPASDLPLGVSPDCQDVAFLPGAVRTRPGLQNIFTPIADAGPVNPTVNYLKTYITPAGQEIMLALDGAGFLWAELNRRHADANRSGNYSERAGEVHDHFRQGISGDFGRQIRN